MGRVNQIASATRFKSITPLEIRGKTFVISEEEKRKVSSINKHISKVGRTDDWFPTMEQAKKLALDPVGNYGMIHWIVSSNKQLANENKEVAKYLTGILETNFITQENLI